jgi:hypothetical protein
MKAYKKHTIKYTVCLGLSFERGTTESGYLIYFGDGVSRLRVVLISDSFSSTSSRVIAAQVLLTSLIIEKNSEKSKNYAKVNDTSAIVIQRNTNIFRGVTSSFRIKTQYSAVMMACVLESATT